MTKPHIVSVRRFGFSGPAWMCSGVCGASMASAYAAWLEFNADDRYEWLRRWWLEHT